MTHPGYQALSQLQRAEHSGSLYSRLCTPTDIHWTPGNMGTLSCLAKTLLPRVSSLFKRLLWQLACCWLDGALPGMAHHFSKWPSSLCQEPRKERVQVGECQCQECALSFTTEGGARSKAVEKLTQILHWNLLRLASAPFHFPLLHLTLRHHSVLWS